jgi:BirA family biotin operon repressor/biotin-[acetyl-CoA-carboxylase] ligase
MKTRVIEFLEENKGKSVSGSEIAAKLNISRAAVWKIINNLKSEGYIIEAVTNRGYCLKEKSDIISETSIKMNLKTKSLGNELQVFKTVTSTNTLAKDLTQNGAKEGLVVISEEQTDGKGRRGRSFFSPSKTGIYMSIVLRPQIDINDTLFITVAASVAVAEAIETLTGARVGIKWVNDLFIDDKKVCGILTEGAIEFESRKLEFAILGIGINFSTKNEEFPNEIQEIAGSIVQLENSKCTRSQLIAEILNKFEEYYNNLTDKSYMEFYKNHSIIIGNNVIIVGDGNKEIYKAINIDDQARLIIEDREGNIKTLNSGEISVKKI